MGGAGGWAGSELNFNNSIVIFQECFASDGLVDLFTWRRDGVASPRREESREISSDTVIVEKGRRQ